MSARQQRLAKFFKQEASFIIRKSLRLALTMGKPGQTFMNPI